MRRIIALTAALLAGTSLTPALAGPFIFAGTDADDHGSATATGNAGGWLFMQRAIENIGAGVVAGTSTSRVVVSLGSDPGTRAGDAAASAFSFSALAATWTYLNINGTAAISNFFNGTGAVNINNTGLIMLDSADINVFGGADSSELGIITAQAGKLDNFLGAGGGLFSQANGYGFLSALVPTVSVVDYSDTGIALTPEGTAAFPGLTNADLSTGPYHEAFSNTGSIPVLGIGIGGSAGREIIIGSSGGTITVPVVTPVPEPASMALLGAGLVGMGMIRRRQA